MARVCGLSASLLKERGCTEVGFIRSCRSRETAQAQAVQQLDYTVIMGTTVFYGSFLVFMVIVVDLIYGLIDPRVRLA